MNRSQVINELAEFISVPSVSANTKKSRTNAVNFLQEKLVSLGFTVELLLNGDDPATIYARRPDAKGSKTIGIYGHYDVQPEDPADEWSTDPFTLTLKNGNFYGRGTADNKDHIIQNIVSIEELILSQSLKNTIVFILEGEEETGSENFLSYIEKLKKKLAEVDVFSSLMLKCMQNMSR